MKNININEVLEIAKKVELNGRDFYLEAARINPEHRVWLTMLADEEIAHESIFDKFQKSLVVSDDEGDFPDDDDTAASYLHAISDTIVFNLAQKVSESIPDGSTIEHILEDAINRENLAILYFTGLKNVMKDKEDRAKIELVIQEEMRHVTWIQNKKKEIEDKENDKSADTEYEVVVVGAGPGGISVAAELIDSGMDKEKILILEESSKTSWIIRKLYPDQKLVTANYKGVSGECNGVMKMRNMTKTDALGMLSETVKDFGIVVRHESPVSLIEKKDDLFHLHSRERIIKAKTCVIAIGVFGQPNRPAYKISRDLIPLTHFDITSTKIENQDVLVVGGGDSAAEYVHFLLKDGNKITHSSREEDLSYMNDDNKRNIQTLGLSSKIDLLAGSDIEKIESENNRIKVNFKGENLSAIIVDRIVYALGGTTPINFLKISGVEVDGKMPKLSEENESSIPGLYLTGDLAAKQNSGAIATAFNASHDVSKSLLKKYLNS